MKLFWTETAKRNLQSIRRYISADNPTAAKRWVGRLKGRARSALCTPLAGRRVPEFMRDEALPPHNVKWTMSDEDLDQVYAWVHED